MLYLSKADYGLWAYTSSVAAIIASISILGFPRAYQNHLAQDQKIDHEYLPLAAIKSIFLGLLIGSFSLLVMNEFSLGAEIKGIFIFIFMSLVVHFILIDYGVIAAQIEKSAITKVYLMALHPNVIRVLIFLIFYFLIFKSQGRGVDAAVFSIQIQLLFTFILVFFYIFSTPPKGGRRAIFPLCILVKEINKKRVIFFLSNVNVVLAAYIGIVLIGIYGTLSDAADFQIIFLLISFSVILPNAIYVRLLGSRVQEHFSTGSIDLTSIYKNIAIMALLGVLVAVVGYLLLAFIIEHYFSEYYLEREGVLLGLVVVISSRFAIAYPFSLMNSGDLIFCKTRLQYFSLLILLLSFFYLPVEDKVVCILFAYAISDVIKLAVCMHKVTGVCTEIRNA